MTELLFDVALAFVQDNSLLFTLGVVIVTLIVGVGLGAALWSDAAGKAARERPTARVLDFPDAAERRSSEPARASTPAAPRDAVIPAVYSWMEEGPIRIEPAAEKDEASAPAIAAAETAAVDEVIEDKVESLPETRELHAAIAALVDGGATAREPAAEQVEVVESVEVEPEAVVAEAALEPEPEPESEPVAVYEPWPGPPVPLYVDDGDARPTTPFPAHERVAVGFSTGAPVAEENERLPA